MVREEILLPVVGRAAVHREPAFENQGVSAEIPRQRQMGAQGEVSASVSRRVELGVSSPIDIFLDLSFDRSIHEVTAFIHLVVLTVQVGIQPELRIGVQVESYTSVHRTDDPRAAPE